MSSSATRRTTESKKKDPKDRRGLLGRMKTILKKSGESSSSSSSPRKHTAMPTLELEQTEPEALYVDSSCTAEQSLPQCECATRIPRIQVHEDRARRLGDTYGVEIEPSEWHSSEGDVYRVEKSLRIHVRKECHKCQTSFGAGKQCPGCNHHHCSKCSRSPPKKMESEKRSSRERREEMAQQEQEFAPILPHYGLAEPIIVTRPSRIDGGQPLVHKVTRMRVRRVCHRCSTTFVSSTRVCHNCGHRRCDDCPHNSPKKKKYPYGYPNDEDGPNTPLYHECHECHEVFAPNTENGVECAVCSHEKCPGCPRTRRRVVNVEPDSDVLRSISSRFEQLDLA